TMVARHALPGVGGPFILVDGDGHTRTDKDFAGRWMLVYFGYTHCPDACPTTLNTVAEALDRMPANIRAKVVPVFITVDPARDKPDIMKAYAESFGPEFVGLTGSDQQIKAVEQAYRVYVAKYPAKADGEYEMDHSSIVYVMGPDGRYRSNFADNAQPGDIASQLDHMVAG
ncbi:MAG TPA: SCO family protein, partial [Stellaceae bacterium]|nr:SCO family protein [Stellaceae bacterium]